MNAYEMGVTPPGRDRQLLNEGNEMARTAARFALKTNEIVRRLKAGNGKIAGLKCFAAVDDVALMPVDVIGIDFFHAAYSGRQIMVEVKPVGGHGSIYVSPAELLDDNPAAIEMFDRKNKAAKEAKAVKDAMSDRERRSLMIDMRMRMTAAQKKKFDESLPDLIGQKAATDAVKAINQISGEYEAASVAKLAVTVLYSLEDVDEFQD